MGSLNIVADSEVARVSVSSSIRGRFLTNNVIIGRARVEIINIISRLIVFASRASLDFVTVFTAQPRQ